MRQDYLDREPFVNSVINLINNIVDNKTGGSFAIDGIWGSGKTFVLDMIENYLESLQDEETADDRYYVFHYNCWEYDYYEEPAIAMISMLLSITEDNLDRCGKHTWEFVSETIKELADKYVENKIGFKIFDTINHNAEKEKESIQAFDNYFGFKKAIDDTREAIHLIAESKPVIIIVDELDRCDPRYAIKVLERLHHFFKGQENVVLVIAVDYNQLDNSVRQIYGANTDIESFLKKFIDFKINLDLGNLQSGFVNNYQKLISTIEFTSDSQKDEAIEIIRSLLSCSEIDIRNQEKILEKATIINKLLFTTNLSAEVLVFELLVLVCMKITYKLKDSGERRASAYYDSFGWITKHISNNKILDLPESFNEYLISFVKTNTSETHINGGTWYSTYDNISGRALYLVDQCYNNAEKRRFQQRTMYEDELKCIDQCKKIAEYARLVI